MTSMLDVARTGELPPLKRKLVGPCRSKCPGGRPCECDGKPHTMHICRDERCWCHSRQRYEEESK